MSDLTEQIEQHLNEQGAEITVLRTVLRGLVARVIVADPVYIEEQLDQMKTDASELTSTPMSGHRSSPTISPCSPDSLSFNQHQAVLHSTPSAANAFARPLFSRRVRLARGRSKNHAPQPRSAKNSVCTTQQTRLISSPGRKNAALWTDTS